MRLSDIYVGVVVVVVDVAKHFATYTDCQKIYDQTVSHSHNSWCLLYYRQQDNPADSFYNQVAWNRMLLRRRTNWLLRLTFINYQQIMIIGLHLVSNINDICFRWIVCFNFRKINNEDNQC